MHVGSRPPSKLWKTSFIAVWSCVAFLHRMKRTLDELADGVAPGSALTQLFLDYFELPQHVFRLHSQLSIVDMHFTVEHIDGTTTVDSIDGPPRPVAVRTRPALPKYHTWLP